MYLALFIYVNAIICKQERVAKTWNGNTFSIKHIEAEKSRRYFYRRYFQTHFLEWKLLCFDSISPKLVSKASADNTPALGQIVAWYRTGDKPLY